MSKLDFGNVRLPLKTLKKLRIIHAFGGEGMGIIVERLIDEEYRKIMKEEPGKELLENVVVTEQV